MDLEKQKNEWARKGAIDRVKFLENLDKIMLSSYVRRIQQNDKTVLREIVLPKWVSWELLREWAAGKKPKEKKGQICILCNEMHENGITFKEKFICEQCFIQLKHADHDAIKTI